MARSEGGLGIGLTIVKRIAELHGGAVTAFNECAGRGSEFTVTLPAIPQPALFPARTQTAEPDVARCSRILLSRETQATRRPSYVFFLRRSPLSPWPALTTVLAFCLRSWLNDRPTSSLS
jgi:hypothetical protein